MYDRPGCSSLQTPTRTLLYSRDAPSFFDFVMLSLTRFISSFFLLLYLSISIKAAALTTAIAPNERVCFYADVDKAGEKIGVCVCYITIRTMQANNFPIVLLRCTFEV